MDENKPLLKNAPIVITDDQLLMPKENCVRKPSSRDEKDGKFL